VTAQAYGNDATQRRDRADQESSARADAIARLAARRDDLRAQLRSLSDDESESGRPRFSNHLAEDAQDQQQRQGAAVVRQMLINDLRQVEHALERSERGQYGICEDCGHDIPPRRLVVIPDATLCVSCQAQREARRSAH